MPTIIFDLRKNPRPAESDSESYHPVVADPQKLTPAQLYERIERRCTVTRTDMVAVMSALAQALAENLANGVSVELPGVGTFTPALRSDAPITRPDDRQTAHHLRVASVNFRPKKELVRQLQGTSFRRTPSPRESREPLSDGETLRLLREYFDGAGQRMLTRATLQQLTGYSRMRALRTLGELTERGVLHKMGHRNSPYYVWADPGSDPQDTGPGTQADSRAQG